MSETEIDPYAVRDEKMLAPPKNFLGRIKYLGPSLIITGAAVGSGELVLTTSPVSYTHLTLPTKA